jgi:hypothetical protein
MQLKHCHKLALRIETIISYNEPEFECHGPLYALLVLLLGWVQKHVELGRFPHITFQPHCRLNTWTLILYTLRLIGGTTRGRGSLF